MQNIETRGTKVQMIRIILLKRVYYKCFFKIRKYYYKKKGWWGWLFGTTLVQRNRRHVQKEYIVYSKGICRHLRTTQQEQDENA